MTYELTSENNTIAIIFKEQTTTKFKNKNTNTYWELDNTKNQLLIRKKNKASKTIFLHATITKINIKPTQTIADSNLENIQITLKTVLNETITINGSDVLKFMYMHPFLSYVNIHDNWLGWDFYDCINTILAYMYTKESTTLLEILKNLNGDAEITILDIDGTDDGILNVNTGDTIQLSATIKNYKPTDNDKIEFYMEE